MPPTWAGDLPPRLARWPSFGLVAVVVFAAFLPALQGGFLSWDDAGYVVENAHIRALSWDTAWWALTEFCCNYWAPLTWLSLAADHAVWGLEPYGFHLTNNLLHALNAGLFLLVAERLVERAAGKAAALPAALVAALAWGLHPLRVESVAWIAERKDVLSATFGLLAVLAWLRHAEAEAAHPAADGWAFLRRPAYLASLLLYGLSLLAKAALVPLPVALLVIDWYPLRRLGASGRRRVLAEKVPYLALAAAAALLTMAAMAPTQRTLAEIDLWSRVLVAFGALSTYLRLTLLPLDINPVYFHPNAVSLTPAVAAAVAVVLLVSSAALWAARRWPAALASWAFFLVTIAPVIGLTQNGKQELAPRFTYVPGMALALLLGAGFGWLWSRLGRSGRAAAGAVAVLALAALVAVTTRDTGHWRDDLTLWTRVLELDPRFGLSYAQRSAALEDRGRIAEALSDLDRALSIAQSKGFSGAPQLRWRRAWLLERLGREQEAAAERAKATVPLPPPEGAGR